MRVGARWRAPPLQVGAARGLDDDILVQLELHAPLLACSPRAIACGRAVMRSTTLQAGPQPRAGSGATPCAAKRRRCAYSADTPALLRAGGRTDA
jgi:hypothetical protein